MQLAHIDSKLKISKTNMRYRDPPPDVSDILPSILTKGVLQPLIVRPEDGKFGVVAGRRRWFSFKAKKEEVGEVDAPPCAIMEEGDDAEAIEASLLENVARRDPDPMREYETFVRLIKEGRTVDDIAATFGLTKTQVNQRLALGNLFPGIREAYRAEEIDDETVRHLTMASPSQQRKWLRLFNDPHQHAPRGYQLKQWLFGGQQIATAHALFKLTDYTGQIVEDLFGEDSYFADADLFWALQNRAIADKREALLKAGWSEVDILEVGERFSQYEHVKVPKKKGGKVFIAVGHDGDVEIFDGWLTQKEAKKLAKAEAREAEEEAARGNKVRRATGRPVMTQALENYIDLHRHRGGAAGADRQSRHRVPACGRAYGGVFRQLERQARSANNAQSAPSARASKQRGASRVRRRRTGGLSLARMDAKTTRKRSSAARRRTCSPSF